MYKSFNGDGDVIDKILGESKICKVLPEQVYGDGGRFSSNIMESKTPNPNKGNPFFGVGQITGFTLPESDKYYTRLDKVKEILTVKEYELLMTPKILEITETEASQLVNIIQKIIEKGVYKDE